VNTAIIKTDYLIIGSGLAGLNAALEAAKYGQVVLVTKATLAESSSYWAQGGIAAVLQDSDSYDSHISDTQKAGRGYCNRKAVEVLVKEGAERVKELINRGMPFEKNGDTLHLGLEGGHSKRRILHADGAATGKAMIDFLISQIRKTSSISVLESTFVYDLITKENRCHGVLAYLYKNGESVQIQSKATILATGGYSSLFTRTTNPHTSTGDGLWLAYNHGAVLKDLEFVQFHPTAFYTKKGGIFLVSEALRGEGARLINSKGERFMETYPQGELSPRDLVAREILNQLEHQNEKFVTLSLTHLNADKMRQRFPGLIERIESHGIDISKHGIPVAPAAHYCIGGIETDIDGQTGVYGLYACGEVAATGVHGANRLASNSLLECLVFSKRAVEHAKNHLYKTTRADFQTPELLLSSELEEPFLFQKREVTKLLNRYAGIERNEAGLSKALHQLNTEMKSALYRHGHEYYFIRMREMLNITERIIKAALYRKESRGVHFRTDFPDADQPAPGGIRFERNNITKADNLLKKEAVL
jgi:L-aspartate oxidase